MPGLPIGYAVRPAIIKNVYRTYVEFKFTDHEEKKIWSCPVPHPYAGFGNGIFAGLQPGTQILVAMAPYEQPYIVSVIPYRTFYFSQEGVPNSTVTMPSYPEMAEGEICIQGPTGSYQWFLDSGNIRMDAGTGNSEADFELSSASEALFLRTNNIYQFTEAGRTIEGIVRRDENSEEDSGDTTNTNFLSGESYDYLLTDVGRSPDNEIYARTSKISKSTVRNPALIEKRDIVYEYADSFHVRGIPLEAIAMLDGYSYIQSIVNPSARENRRTDILDLNIRNYNHLIERVQGTVVDIYGNVLDINRNIINIPTKISTTPSASSAKSQAGAATIQDLQRLYSFSRRSVKYHLEINSRKPTSALDFSIQNTSNNISQHSRWSIDVDGEGLTKVNIPASSETGNIPLLGRYYTSINPHHKKLPDIGDGSWKDPNFQDVRFLPFGKKMGESIADSKYMPVTSPSPVDGVKSISIPNATVGTANYPMMNVASSVFTTGKLRNPNPGIGAPTVPPFSTTAINNQILDYGTGENPNANAGGRSLNMNLDGSAEVSIGADTIDRKSLVLDLAGGIISHYGRDLNGRSMIHQADGDVIIQVGGPGISSDTRFQATKDTENRPGRVEIHLNRPGGSSQKIIIDENGITMQIFGNGVIQTSGDLTLTAGGNLLLNGEGVYIHGEADTDIDGTRSITGTEKLIVRNGRIS